jgi:dienelactone hydrolase
MMTEVLLFHHVQGLTPGVHAIADSLREAGHTVHTPDFFEGRTFGSIDDGFAAVKAKGPDAQRLWADKVAGALPADIVYAGISLGVMPAQRLAQTRPGARGAVLLESCAPVSAFGDGWPADVPVQVHGMEADPFFAGEGDVDNARELVAQAKDGALFVYPGDAHLFTDSSLPSGNPAAIASVLSRVLAFLERV